MRFSLGWLLLMLLSAPSWAAKVGDIDVPDAVRLESGQQLVLNGAGMRTKMFFDIYVAALYLPQKEKQAKAIIASGDSRRMAMHFVYSEVSKSKMDDAWQDGVADNYDAALPVELQARLDGFKKLFGDMHKGDIAVLDFIPGAGTSVSINGQLKGSVPGDDLASALLAVWLGDKPIGGKLKEALLGGK